MVDGPSNEDMAEENRLLRASLNEAIEELASLRRENERLIAKSLASAAEAEEAFCQLQIVRSSLEWKMLTPIRLLRESIR